MALHNAPPGESVAGQCGLGSADNADRPRRGSAGGGPRGINLTGVEVGRGPGEKWGRHRGARFARWAHAARVGVLGEVTRKEVAL